MTLRKTSRSSNKAFTLIELLVVMAILGVLFAITAYTVASVSSHSRDNTRKQDLLHIQTALEQYNTDQRSYPVFDNLLSTSGVPILSAAWQLSSSPSCPHSVTSIKNIYPEYLSGVIEDPLSINSNFAGQTCQLLESSSQTNRYIYISSSPATSYALLAQLEAPVNMPNEQLINSANAPYSFAPDPFTNNSSPFYNSYKEYNNSVTGEKANYILLGGNSR